MANNNLNVNSSSQLVNASANNLILGTTNQTFNSFYSQFLINMQQTSIWTTLAPTGVGSTLLGDFATLAVACNFYTASRLAEAFIDTAQSALSVYTLVNLLGGTILGNSPSFSEISYTSLNTDPITIPAFSTFSINGGIFYNAVNVTLNSQIGSTIGTGTFILTEGNPVFFTATSTGNPNQTYYLSSGYMSSAEATTVTIINGNQENQWTQVESLWLDGFTYNVNPVSQVTTTTPLPVFQAKLYATGSIQVIFGDGIRGIIPPTGNTIQIISYNATGGTLNANASLNSLFQVTVSSVSNDNADLLTQIATVNMSTASIQGGLPAPSPNIYKTTAPAQFADSGRFVSDQDYEAGLLDFTYDNVRPILAASVYGEKDISPGNAALANSIVAVIVTYPILLASQDFTSVLSDYLGTYGVFALADIVPADFVEFDYFNVNVTRLDISLTADQIITLVQTALENLLGVWRATSYTTAVGSSTTTTSVPYNIYGANSDLIGASWYISEFYNAISTVLGVNQVQIQYSYLGLTSDFSLDYTQYLAITLDRINISVTNSFA